MPHGLYCVSEGSLCNTRRSWRLFHHWRLKAEVYMASDCNRSLVLLASVAVLQKAFGRAARNHRVVHRAAHEPIDEKTCQGPQLQNHKHTTGMKGY